VHCKAKRSLLDIQGNIKLPPITGGSQTTDKPFWHASTQPSPTEGKGDRKRSEAVEEVAEILDYTKFFELNSSHHLIRQLALRLRRHRLVDRDCVGVFPSLWEGYQEDFVIKLTATHYYGRQFQLLSAYLKYSDAAS